MVIGARDGSTRNRSGDVYKPSALRPYLQALRLRIYRISSQRGSLTSAGPISRSSSIVRLGRPQRLNHTARAHATSRCLPAGISRGEVVVNPTSGLLVLAV
jgi:hypothetical protein